MTWYQALSAAVDKVRCWRDRVKIWPERVKSWFKKLPVETKVSLVATLVTTGIGIAAIIAEVATPEIRCFFGFSQCASDDSQPQPDPAPRSSPPYTTTARPTAPTSSPDKPKYLPDPNQPYVREAPPPRRIEGEMPAAEIAFNTITNRGKPVAIPLTGRGFTANAHIGIDMYMPNGGTYLASGFDTDDRGLFNTSLMWLPLRHYGVGGNNGGWKIVLTDRASGQKAIRLLNVESDAQTSEPRRWKLRTELSRETQRRPSIDIGSGGTLCGDNGVRTVTAGSGFTPEASLTLTYYRADGQKIGQRGLIANGAGELDPVYDYWAIASCESGGEFEYRFELSENGTDRKVTGTAFLPSS